MSYREHDWAYEEACKWDNFVEQRMTDYFEILERTTRDAVARHGKILLVFDDRLLEEAQMMAEHIETMEDFQKDMVIVCSEEEYSDPENYLEDLIRAEYFKVSIDFGPDLDPYSDFDPPEPW